LYADAFAMTGEWNKADDHLEKGQQLFFQEPDSLLRPALETRVGRRQWEIYRNLTYHSKFPDSTTFAEAHYRTKIRSIQEAIESERWERLQEYIRQLLERPLHLKYFDDYQQYIHQLAFLGKADMAQQFIEEVNALQLRKRYRDRLQQEQKWLDFMKSQKENI